MGAFLSRLLGWIAPVILNWALEKVTNSISKMRRQKQIDEESKESVKPGEKAKTEKEIDDSLRDTIGGGW